MYFNLLIFLILIPISIKQKRFFKSLLLFLLFFILGMSPSIKNKILFDVFSNSSWTGLNAAQATGYDRKDWSLCSFRNDYIDKYNKTYKSILKNRNYLNKKILNDKSFNDLGYIYKSINCDQGSKEHLISNFQEITKQKMQRFLSVHAHLSFDFAFKPKNWKNSLKILEKLNNNDLFKVIVFIFFFINYLFYLFVTTLSLFKKNKNFIDYFLIANLILYSYLLLVSFYGSTWEQERMRYTGYSFIFICLSLMINKIIFLKKKSEDNFVR